MLRATESRRPVRPVPDRVSKGGTKPLTTPSILLTKTETYACGACAALRFAKKLPVSARSLQIPVDNSRSGSVSLAPMGFTDPMNRSRVSLFPPSSIEEIIRQIMALDDPAFEVLHDDIVGGGRGSKLTAGGVRISQPV